MTPPSDPSSRGTRQTKVPAADHPASAPPTHGDDGRSDSVGSRTVAVVAPSGPVPVERLAPGMKLITRALGTEPWRAPNLERRDGYFAGDDADRLEGLVAALRQDVDVVWVARGGYGLTRILGRLDPAPIRARPPTLVGFSDATALLCWAWVTARAVGVHGPVVTQLAELGPEDRDRVFAWLAGDVPPPLSATEGTVCRGGTIEGPLLAGNVEVLRSLIGTPWLPSLEGCVLALEEVGERPYRLDRALTQLLYSGALRGVRGIVVGQLHGCHEPEHGTSHGMSAEEVVVERLETLGIPIVTGFPFGHAPGVHAALPFGARVRLHADDATLEFLEPVRRSPG